MGEDLAESEYYSGQQSEFEETIDEVEYDFDKDKTRVKQRGDINILLCGDPGTLLSFYEH